MTTHPDLVELIKEQVSIVDVISRVVQLKQRGNTWQGLCPFHQEKTPSFHVYTEKSHYHCYGCHRHGDVISFVQQYQQLSFKDALKQLCQDHGLDYKVVEKQESDQHQRLSKLLQKAALHFHQELLSLKSVDKPVLFLKDKSIATKQLVQRFSLGWASGALLEALKQEFSEKDLLEVGLYYEYEGRLKARFYQRLMFPIYSESKKIVGFGGRRVDYQKGDKAPKYLNSPETALFKKSHLLYGMHLISNYPYPWFFVVEGYTDVIQLAQHQLPAVAPMGTALTLFQFQKLISRQREVIFCYDGDTAGLEASKKALLLILPYFKADYKIAFITLPHGQDPDSYLYAHGKEPFINLCKKRVPFVEYFFQVIEKDFLTASLDGQMKFVAKVRSLIRSIEDPDARRGVESSFYQYQQKRKESAFVKRTQKNQPLVVLPDPLSNTEMLRVLLVVTSGQPEMLSENDKKLLIYSNDTTVSRLLCGKISAAALKKLAEEYENSYAKVLSLISRQHREKELKFQMAIFKKNFIALLLASAPEIRSALREEEKKSLEATGCPRLRELLTVSSPDRLKALKIDIQKKSGLSLSISQEKYKPLLLFLIKNLNNKESHYHGTAFES